MAVSFCLVADDGVFAWIDALLTRIGERHAGRASWRTGPLRRTARRPTPSGRCGRASRTACATEVRVPRPEAPPKFAAAAVLSSLVSLVVTTCDAGLALACLSLVMLDTMVSSSVTDMSARQQPGHVGCPRHHKHHP